MKWRLEGSHAKDQFTTDTQAGLARYQHRSRHRPLWMILQVQQIGLALSTVPNQGPLHDTNAKKSLPAVGLGVYALTEASIFERGSALMTDATVTPVPADGAGEFRRCRASFTATWRCSVCMASPVITMTVTACSEFV